MTYSEHELEFTFAKNKVTHHPITKLHLHTEFIRKTTFAASVIRDALYITSPRLRRCFAHTYCSTDFQRQERRRFIFMLYIYAFYARVRTALQTHPAAAVHCNDCYKVEAYKKRPVHDLHHSYYSHCNHCLAFLIQLCIYCAFIAIP